MSCWVTPEIAAQFWNSSVEQVMEGINSGQIASQHDLGRLFVDVAPDSPRMQTVAEAKSDEMSNWKIGREEAETRRIRPIAA